MSGCSRRRWRKGPAALALALATVTLAGCNSAASPLALSTDDPSATRSAPAATPAAVAGPLAPLTGVPVQGSQGRPAVAVVVAAADRGAALKGLESADIVYVEYAEPGFRRMLAVYASRTPDEVGPVGGTRPADRDLLKVIDPVLVFGPSYQRFGQQVDRSDLKSVDTAGRPDLFTGDAGARYALMPALVAAATDGRPPPVPVLTYARPGDPLGTLGVTPARSVEVAVPGHATQSWRYDDASASWLNDTSGPVKNLIVQRVDFKAIVANKDQRAVPSARVVGDGVAQVFSGGQLMTGTWHKPGVGAVTNYTDAALLPVRLAPGNTQVLLVPSDATVTVAAP